MTIRNALYLCGAKGADGESRAQFLLEERNVVAGGCPPIALDQGCNRTGHMSMLCRTTGAHRAVLRDDGLMVRTEVGEDEVGAFGVDRTTGPVPVSDDNCGGADAAGDAHCGGALAGTILEDRFDFVGRENSIFSISEQKNVVYDNDTKPMLCLGVFLLGGE